MLWKVVKKISAPFFLFSSFFLWAQEQKDSLSTKIKKVILIGRNPISEKFSVEELHKLDIYFNPASKADPLNAITILPSSTNTEETANPVLRGGSADRSRVYINGVPIINPVRNTQDNGLGNFSLFNTELIDKQYIYPSNPPLSYGNSSAGIVTIETNKRLENNNLQLSTALSNIGALWNKKLGKNNFFQGYGNIQFSSLLTVLNRKSLQNLHNFSSKDLGFNTHLSILKNGSFNTYNYFIDEAYNAKDFSLNYAGTAYAGQRRFFSVNNLDYRKGRSKVRAALSSDWARRRYTFGNIDSKSNSLRFFAKIHHQYQVNKKLSIQYGLDYIRARYHYNQIHPLFSYTFRPENPAVKDKEITNFYTLESYLYTDYELTHRLGLSAAIRKNIISDKNITPFWSEQFSAHYRLGNNQWFFSAGNYHSYSTPTEIKHGVHLLSSRQAALDYKRQMRKWNLSAAFYAKQDQGNFQQERFRAELFDKIQSLGFEFSIKHDFLRYFSGQISNTFLHQKGYIGEKIYRTKMNLHYFIKSQLTYSHPQIFTASMVAATRAGNYYTPVMSAEFDSAKQFYIPAFSSLNRSEFKPYFRLDFTMNKVIAIRDNGLIVYLSISNVLNRKNQRSVYYNQKYSKTYFNFYQQRILYFGLQFRMIN